MNGAHADHSVQCALHGCTAWIDTIIHTYIVGYVLRADELWGRCDIFFAGAFFFNQWIITQRVLYVRTVCHKSRVYGKFHLIETDKQNNTIFIPKNMRFNQFFNRKNSKVFTYYGYLQFMHEWTVFNLDICNTYMNSVVHLEYCNELCGIPLTNKKVKTNFVQYMT